MSQKTYIANDESLKSFADLNYLDLAKHESIWKNMIDTHPFNQAVNAIAIYNKSYLLCFFFFS